MLCIYRCVHKPSAREPLRTAIPLRALQSLCMPWKAIRCFGSKVARDAPASFTRAFTRPKAKQLLRRGVIPRSKGGSWHVNCTLRCCRQASDSACQLELRSIYLRRASRVAGGAFAFRYVRGTWAVVRAAHALRLRSTVLGRAGTGYIFKIQLRFILYR